MKHLNSLGLAVGISILVACSSEVPLGNHDSVSGKLGSLGEPPRADGTCDAALVPCGGTCTDLSTDAKNCGACGLVCGYGRCDTGVCAHGPTVHD